MSSLRLLAAALLLLLAASVVAQPQRDPKPGEPYALIFGTLYGPDKRPAHGVKVLIRRSDKKKPKWRHISDRRGEFAQRVPAGKAEYIVTADVKGKSPKPEVKVKVENDERLDISLHLTE